MFIQALQNQDFYTLFILGVSATAISSLITIINSFDDIRLSIGSGPSLSEIARTLIITFVSILTVDSLISNLDLAAVLLTGSLLSYALTALSTIVKNTSKQSFLEAV